VITEYHYPTRVAAIDYARMLSARHNRRAEQAVPGLLVERDRVIDQAGKRTGRLYPVAWRVEWESDTQGNG